jgi:DNA-binding SARP family transcriptional activator
MWKGGGGMSVVKIYLFGQLSVECNEKVWTGPEGGKSRELFCYLLIRRNVHHNRERLASLLWEATSTAQSKKYLRQALWQIQASCDDHLGKENGRLFLADQEWVQMNPEAEVWVDVTAFDQTFSRLRAARDLDESSALALDDAARLYRDDLLVDWRQDWLLYERERLQNTYLIMLDKLAAYSEARRDYAAGVSYGARILQYDPAREHTHQQMMRMYYLAGDRIAALRQFERCVESLRRELDVGPSPSTLALREQICLSHLPQPSPTSHSSPPEPSALLPSILENLKQLQDKLVEMQSALQQDIQAVEQAMPQLKRAANESCD